MSLSDQIIALGTGTRRYATCEQSIHALRHEIDKALRGMGR